MRSERPTRQWASLRGDGHCDDGRTKTRVWHWLPRSPAHAGLFYLVVSFSHEPAFTNNQ